MQTFRQYVENNDKIVGDLGARDHREELMDFFRNLATKNHTIRHELDNMSRNDINSNLRPKGKPQTALDSRDEIVPTASDGIGAES